jgi:hypothetical protein
VELAKALQPMGERAEYIRIDGSGPNAVDFHISFYIGQIAAADANSYFLIVSKDTGFDPLIEHLKSKKILSKRVLNIEEILKRGLNGTMKLDDKISAVITDMKRRGQSRPRKVATLTSSIIALFQKSISEQDAVQIVDALKAKKFISVQGTAVSYNLN